MVIEDTTVDYSQPILLATPPSAQEGQSTADPAAGLLDTARDAFVREDYAAALAYGDKALAKQPDTPLMHEFRALTLFALGRYKEAAAPVYAVLSLGPGWDWATLIGFYPRPDVYTEQLRALEKYVTDNPKLAEARFLLAYHYMTCGHNDAAASQLTEAARLNPKDRLSAQLLSALKPSSAAKPPAPPVPAKPVDAASLVGTWTATRDEGAPITLSLTEDSHYTWKCAWKGKPQEFSGIYSVADNLLILKKDNAPVMVGQVTMLADNQFHFKLPGENPNDPGLTFSK